MTGALQAGAIVLTAGRSRRMGQPKVLLPWKSFTVLVEIARAIGAHALTPAVFVSNPEIAEAVRATAHSALLVINSNADDQMIDSLKLGAAALLDGGPCAGAVLLLADNPGQLEARVGALLGAARARPDVAWIPTFNGERGHPVWLPAGMLRELAHWNGEEGLRGFLRAKQSLVEEIDVPWGETLHDLDTPEEYRRATDSAR